MLEGKTVLITGATGLLGSNLVKECIARRARVIVLGRSEEKIQGCFREHIGSENFAYIAKDISDIPLKLSEPVDYIFHAAGSIEYKTIVNSPIDIIAPNIIGTIACLEFLKNQREIWKKAGRLVYFSSEAVYGRADQDRNVIEDNTEFADEIKASRAPYSHSKRMAEVIVNGYIRQYDIDAVNVRFAWVYGNAKYRPKQALFDFIEQALAGENIVIKNSNTPRRDNLYMADAMAALLLIAEKGVTGEVYNISSNGDKGNYVGADEIAEIVVDIINKKRQQNLKVIYESLPTEREGGVRMDNTRLKQLGWSVTTGLYDGICKLIEEVENNVY